MKVKLFISLIIIIVCANFKCTEKCGTLLLVIILIFVFGLGIGVLIGYCCVQNKKGTINKNLFYTVINISKLCRER